MRFPINTRRPLRHLDRFNSDRSDARDLEELWGLIRGAEHGDLIEAGFPCILHEAHDLTGQLFFDAVHFGAHDAQFLVQVRVVYPEVQATAAQSVGEVAGAIGGQEYQGWVLGLYCTNLGYCCLKVGQYLKQEGFELLVSAVNLVNEKHPRAGW